MNRPSERNHQSIDRSLTQPVDGPRKGDWQRRSWRGAPANQQADFGDPERLASVLQQIQSYPPLVAPGEIMKLRRQLGEAEIGKRFLLQGGDCAERFADCTPAAINEKVSLLLRMGLVLTSCTGKPVIKVGRIAGQYAKPRSATHETFDGRVLPVFRGDSVHDFESRVADPGRLLQAYHAASLTLNYIRSQVAGGFTDASRAHEWTVRGITKPLASRFGELVRSVKNAVELATAFGVQSGAVASPGSHDARDIFASHEGLLLEFEEAMTRFDAETGAHFNLSAHTLWIGDRTRQVGGAHVEYFRGIANPVGLKIGAGADPAEIAHIVRTLNPLRERGKLILVTRLGVKHVERELPALIEAVRATRTPVLWCCDPMHGNTVRASNGFKTRLLADITTDLESTIAIHREAQSRLGGIHLEMTGDAVTECVGEDVLPEHLPVRYETYCDPRLNASQSHQLAFLLADALGH
ncbi:MAG: hypothetical protein RIQ81_1009 [Pseudomonadota bacterium]